MHTALREISQPPDVLLARIRELTEMHEHLKGAGLLNEQREKKLMLFIMLQITGEGQNKDNYFLANVI